VPDQSERKEEKAMIARLDYRRRLTAALALATIVVLWVVFAAFVITSPQATAPTSGTGGGSDFTNSPTIERHAEVVAAYNAAH
jgi:hypothetical protein